jgi:hypothetical protein
MTRNQNLLDQWKSCGLLTDAGADSVGEAGREVAVGDLLGAVDILDEDPDEAAAGYTAYAFDDHEDVLRKILSPSHLVLNVQGTGNSHHSCQHHRNYSTPS